ncbi:DUF2550 domain-containing protein [Actinopolymorpha pittospori]|jgi:hypothetical protein|uniref:DUF2550 domain-containing protein n=1 Tax=Actinopolymorpha pittospori TaxID=648752 RepID=A0A927N2S3_9ACTN|nr:DUF2550 domain-containing protein [Actinopolymorpha pittospori]MBE1611586.1 hypothetical protein [Actinopolymorpha pittospori]
MIEIVLDIAGVLLALVIFCLAGLAFRRRLLQRGGGTFDSSLRLHKQASGKGWSLGIARYSGDSVEWFRVFSFGFRPRRVFSRNALVVNSRRDPAANEALGLYAGHVVIECQQAGQGFELAMAEDALTGFLAWLEAAPPGRRHAPL